MSLSGALNVGKSALAVHQAAIQVTSNNISNAGNADYTRQSAQISANRDQSIGRGLFVGTGVNLTSIRRNIDEALEARLRGSISDSELANVRQQWLGRVEGVFNELGDDDLSTALSTFFNDWSKLASQPQDQGLRQIVVQDGQTLADTFHDLRNSFADLQADIDNRLTTLARDANGIADQIAQLNGEIQRTEGAAGGNNANGLRDNRDALLKQLSELMDIKTTDAGNGVVNVSVGSNPLIIGTTNRGVVYKTETVNGQLTGALADGTNGRTLGVTSGQFGGMTAIREEIGSVIDQLDTLAGQLVFELNKIHSAGQGLEGYSQVTGTTVVADNAAPLNTAAARLDFAPVNGSFVVHVKEKSSGLVTSTLVQVDLDGLNGDDTSLDSLAADLDAIDGLSATIAGGRLRLQAESGALEFSFSQDSSGTLAALGVNTFFKGSTAADIAVQDDLRNRPSLLAVARNGQRADNQTALEIAKLESKALAGLGGTSLTDAYEKMINGVATSAAAAKTSANSAAAIQETLFNQREALSGVSLDEEAVALMREQRAFQGAARIITAVDELMQTLLNMV